MRTLIGRMLAWFLAPQLDAMNVRVSVAEMAIAGHATHLQSLEQATDCHAKRLVSLEIDGLAVPPAEVSPHCRITIIESAPGGGRVSRISSCITDAPSEVTRLSTVEDDRALSELNQDGPA